MYFVCCWGASPEKKELKTVTANMISVCASTEGRCFVLSEILWEYVNDISSFLGTKVGHLSFVFGSGGIDVRLLLLKLSCLHNSYRSVLYK